MVEITNKDLKLFKRIARTDPVPLLRSLSKYLKRKGYLKVISTKKYVIGIGECPIAMTAHTDTVFPTRPQNIFYDREQQVMWSPEGLGADDRAGVFSIIKIIELGYRPTVIFTTDEEIGGIGAEALVQKFKFPVAEMKYIIEMDRCSSDDCVFYDCGNEEFAEYIEKFGFFLNFGSFSDISVFCPAWDVAGVNLSVGYYNEHSYIETLNFKEMFQTIERVCLLLDDADSAEFFDYQESLPANYLKNYLFNF